MAKQEQAIHFSDGEKIICGTKNGRIASGDEVVTCKRCLGLLEDARMKEAAKTPPAPSVNQDPNAVHFSDGEKAACNAIKGTAVMDEQKVNCPNCMQILADKANRQGDPLVEVRVKNLDLNDGVDFTFTFEGTPYRLVNNAAHRLPKSVVKHLKGIAYPFRRYVEGQESGQAMPVAGKRHRFAVTPL